MGMKAAGADLCFKGGLFKGNRWLAAFSSATAELSGSGYARIQTVLADWQADGRKYENAAIENFPLPSAAWLGITHWGLYSASTSGTLLIQNQLSSATPAPTIGASVGFDAEAVSWALTGALTQTGSQKAQSEGLFSGTRYLVLCTGDPLGAADTIQNQLSGVNPLLTKAADWSLDSPSNTSRRARNNKILSFGSTSTDVDRPTHVALADGNSTSAKVLASDQFDVQANDPALGDTLSFAAQALQVSLTVDAP